MKNFLKIALILFCMISFGFAGCTEDGGDIDDEEEIQVIFSGIGSDPDLHSNEDLEINIIVLDENDQGVIDADVTLTSTEGNFIKESGKSYDHNGLGLFSTTYRAPDVDVETEAFITARVTKSDLGSGKTTISITINPKDNDIKYFVASLKPGEGDMNSGVLFSIQKSSVSTESVKIDDLRFKVGEEDGPLVTLKWPEDGNTSAFSLDSGLKEDDDEWWDPSETVGFDAPHQLTGIKDGDTIEVSIIELDEGTVIFFDDFIYESNTIEPDPVKNIIATLEQGDGNMTSGVLFVMQKGSGDSVKIADYRFKVGEKGGSLITLKWPEDGNTTSYNIDSGLKYNDGEWWDTTERIGFDAPPGLTGIVDGDLIEVFIINLDTGDVVFNASFVYRN